MCILRKNPQTNLIMPSKNWHRIAISLIPLAVLLVLLALNISLFGSDAILGASQVALLCATGVCIWLSMWLFKVPWEDFEETVKDHVGSVTSAILILFLIGAVSGTWTMSGIVPTFISWGIKLIHPKVFLLTACVICALVSLMVGSSWTTIATIGVALMGIGKAEGFSEALTAGAVISGAYFGDKISPLSDTTVLASSLNKVPLFTHIKYMLLTTVPSIVISLAIFGVIGLLHPAADAGTIAHFQDTLSARFNLSPWLMVVPVVTVLMIARKMPALVVLALSTLLAAVFALVFQPDVIREIGMTVTGDAPQARVMLAGTVRTIYDTVTVETGNPEINALVTSRGMLGMLNTVFLIICAMCFGASMHASGMLRNIASLLVPFTRGRVGLVASTAASGTLLNGIVSDQYLSIILTSNLFRDTFEERGYENRLLSRTIEDSATVTSPLFPWSSCGMTQATILNVSTLAYFPYCFFNIISPVMSVFVAITGYKIFRKEKTTSPS